MVTALLILAIVLIKSSGISITDVSSMILINIIVIIIISGSSSSGSSRLDVEHISESYTKVYIYIGIHAYMFICIDICF